MDLQSGNELGQEGSHHYRCLNTVIEMCVEVGGHVLDDLLLGEGPKESAIQIQHYLVSGHQGRQGELHKSWAMVKFLGAFLKGSKGSCIC